MIKGAQVGSLTDWGFLPVTIEADHGTIDCRYYKSGRAASGIIFIGGATVTWDSPAQGLYPLLAKEMLFERVSSLRLRFGYPSDVQTATRDVVSAVDFMQQEGVRSVALIGHGLGGAAAIQAAGESDSVMAVITLATQSFGADRIVKWNREIPLLLIHGAEDMAVPVECSFTVYEWADEPTDIKIYEMTGHDLHEAAEEVYQSVSDWIRAHLK